MGFCGRDVDLGGVGCGDDAVDHTVHLNIVVISTTIWDAEE